MLYTCFLVALGGAAGTLMRFGAGRLQLWWAGPSLTFPYATLGVNVAGCLFLGMLWAEKKQLSDSAFIGLSTGFCGGLTTFSTFMAEIYLMNETSKSAVWIYFVLSLGLGLGAFGLGNRFRTI